MVTPNYDHPAKFSPPVLEAMADVVTSEWQRQVEIAGRRRVLSLVDPFAGVGGIHDLQHMTGGKVSTLGIEIEPEWAATHTQTFVGNSRTLQMADPAVRRRLRKNGFDIFGTSYVYGNRMSDHHDATDESKRFGYKFSLGHDLTPDNAGELYFWNEEYKALHWDVYSRFDPMIKPGGLVILNGSDFGRTVYQTRNKVKTSRRIWYPVSAWHRNVWESMGYTLESIIPVKTKRMKNGANREVRADHETVTVLRKLPADVTLG